MTKKVPTSPTPKCDVCGKAWALKKPDPDGGRRCYAHSTDPLSVERRAKNGLQGAAVGARMHGVPNEKRMAVLNGAVSLDEVRAETLAAKQRKKVEPIPLDTKAHVLAFLARVAGELMDQQPTGWASAAAAIAGQALKAQGFQEQDGDDDEAPRGFAYETTTGEAVAVRGREAH